MSSHGAFVLAAYLAALVVFGSLIVASVGARNKARRELAARGLDRRR